MRPRPSEPYRSVCDGCYRQTWYDVPANETIPHPTCREGGRLHAIDTSALDPRYTPFYENEARVEVTFTDGTKERFWIGKSMGWKPIYLAVKTTRSLGGTSAPTKNVASIREVRRRMEYR